MPFNASTHLKRARQRIAQASSLAVISLLFLTGGVPWVDGLSTPGFDGRQPLTKKQEADAAYRKGRRYFDEASGFEEKSREASNNTKQNRYADKARARYRASADAYALALRRARNAERQPDYLPNLYLEMGDALFKTSQFDAANDAYLKAINVAPAFLNGHYGLARARLARGELGAVRESFQRLRQEADTRADAWSYVDELMKLVGNWVDSDAARSLGADQVSEFRAWYVSQQDELTDTIRWTALEQK